MIRTLAALMLLVVVSHAVPIPGVFPANAHLHNTDLEVMPPPPEDEDWHKMPKIPRAPQMPRMPLPIDINAVIFETETSPEMPVSPPTAPAGTVGRDPNVMPPLSKRRVEMQSPCLAKCQADMARWHHTLHLFLGLVSIVTLSLAGGFLVWRYVLVPWCEAKPSADTKHTDEASWSSQVFLDDDDTQNRDFLDDDDTQDRDLSRKISPKEAHVKGAHVVNTGAHVVNTSTRKKKKKNNPEEGDPREELADSQEYWKGNLSDGIPTPASNSYQSVSLPEPVSQPARTVDYTTGQSTWMDHMPREGMGSTHSPELLPSPDPPYVPPYDDLE